MNPAFTQRQNAIRVQCTLDLALDRLVIDLR